MCVCDGWMVDEVKIVCLLRTCSNMHGHMPAHMRTYTHSLFIRTIFACLYGGIFPAGIEEIDRMGQVNEAGIKGGGSN